jgi:hypothetical protein
MAQNGGSRRGQGGKLWAGARGYACSDCCEGGPDGETSLMSNDKSIVPALSAAELAYQCNGTALPCKLHWYPGKNCYKITNATFSAGVPGYAARAAKSRGWAPIIRQTGIRQTACNTDTVQRGARRPWRPGCSPPTTTRSSRSCSAPRRSGPALGA